MSAPQINYRWAQWVSDNLMDDNTNGGGFNWPPWSKLIYGWSLISIIVQIFSPSEICMSVQAYCEKLATCNVSKGVFDKWKWTLNFSRYYFWFKKSQTGYVWWALCSTMWCLSTKIYLLPNVHYGTFLVHFCLNLNVECNFKLVNANYFMWD